MAMVAKGLAKLAEELGELSQIVGKKLAYFYTDKHPDGEGSLQERMENEIGDVLAAIDFVTRKMNLNRDAISRRFDQKRIRFNTWDSMPEEGHEGVDRSEREGK